MGNITPMHIQAWVRQLVPNVYAIYQNPITGKRLRVKILEVSTKGVITTEVGEFKYPDIGDKIVGYNGTMGWLFPEEDISDIEIPPKLNKYEKKKEAKLFCAAVVSGDLELPSELIESLLVLKRRYA